MSAAFYLPPHWIEGIQSFLTCVYSINVCTGFRIIMAKIDQSASISASAKYKMKGHIDITTLVSIRICTRISICTFTGGGINFLRIQIYLTVLYKYKCLGIFKLKLTTMINISILLLHLLSIYLCYKVYISWCSIFREC